MQVLSRLAFFALPVLFIAGCGSTDASRDVVRAVGSSTVLPFAKIVAQDFARNHPEFKSPIIESTGTGAGFALFCRGIGPDTPDIADASRRMKPAEFAECQANGVTDIVEVQVGLDGIAFASAKNGITMNLTPEIVYRALAARPFGQPQTAQRWSDVDPSLPNQRILVYGPPATSGTRDALNELVLEKGCAANPQMAALAERDEEEHDKICTELRNDGAFVAQGEQDNLIVQKIEANPQSVGIFGFSYLEENLDRLQDLPMNGVMATYDNIASFQYLGARPMFIYVKRAHVDAIPGLRQFVATWVANWGRDGALAQNGLVASPPAVAEENARRASDLSVLTADDLA